MPTPDEIAGENLATLRTYGPDTYKSLEKKCRSDDGNEKTTVKNMRAFLINHGLAKEVAPGHASGKSGDKLQPGTTKFLKEVAQALREA
jgi:hypothetical protein